MPGVVVSGTILFYALGLAVLVGTYMMPSNKDKGLTATLVVLTVVCTWLMWLITFMMQVNPLIYPLMPQAEGEELLNVTNATVLEE